MKELKIRERIVPVKLKKTPTGIRGLDEITEGGLPMGRPTLVCGGAGCGKTMLGMEFIYRGAIEFNEPGVFISFEEMEADLKENFASLGFELDSAIKRDLIALDYVHIERSEIEETGEFDLEGLFIRLAAAIDAVGAKRVVLDTLEALFTGFSNKTILRAELRRLFRWLKERGLTAVITGEKGEKGLTRHNLEEYVADCVIFLDHRVREELSTRRLKIIKYRGSHHGTNEYPFLIGRDGITIFPITSLLLDNPAGTARISSGIEGVDGMMEGGGFYVGSVILVSGGAGTGKTSFLAHFANAACMEGRKAIFLSFEESEHQILRNMRSIGLDLDRWKEMGLLKFSAHRGTYCGMEKHLVMAHRLVEEFAPDAVIIDPISGLVKAGTLQEARAMLSRLLDFLRERELTVMMSDLSGTGYESGDTGVGISSVCDAWIRLAIEEIDHHRERRIRILKVRGISHSHEVNRLLISGEGISVEGIPGRREG